MRRTSFVFGLFCTDITLQRLHRPSTARPQKETFNDSAAIQSTGLLQSGCTDECFFFLFLPTFCTSLLSPVSEAFLQSEPWTPDMGDPCFYTTCNCWWCLRVLCPGKHNELLYSRCALQDAILKKVSFLTRQKLLFFDGGRPVLYFQIISLWQVENETQKISQFLTNSSLLSCASPFFFYINNGWNDYV